MRIDSMTYMNCKSLSYMPRKILEHIASSQIGSSYEIIPHIYIMKFMLKIFISHHSENYLLSFDLKMIFNN